MSDSLDWFVDAGTLRDVLDGPGVQVIAVDSPRDYAEAHIPGALQITMADFTADAPPVSGLIPDDDRLAEALSDAGLRNDAHIVAYDRAGDGQAARLLYTLDAMGHRRFSLLDGGLDAWRNAGFELERGEAQAGRSQFTVDRQSRRIADRQWIAARLDDPRVQLLDARSAPEYAGSDVRAARGGHIPGAISMDWRLFKTEHGRLRKRRELLELLSQHHVDDNAEIVHYCQSHTRSSYTYLVLKSLGYDHQRGYPGAWSEWGNADDTPVNNSLGSD